MKQRGFTLIELLIVVAIIAIIGAIAIPSLLRSRASANEGAIQGDVRTVITAAVAYEAASGGNGYPTSITCLNRPGAAGCLANYPANGPTFVDAVLGAADRVTKSGYARSYQPSATAQGSGSVSFCYQAKPVDPGRSGVRSFGGDRSGVVGVNPANVDCCTGGNLATTCSAVK